MSLKAHTKKPGKGLSRAVAQAAAKKSWENRDRHADDGETVGSGGGFDSGLKRLLLSIAGLVTQ
jgi:hypothetical protein